MLKRPRVLLEAATSALTGVLGLVTPVWHDWIEMVFGSDPDHGNGSLELLIVATCLAVAVISGLAARRSWRSSRLAEG
jgi:hypothetical protein